jgi:hypothetical protein
MVYGKYNYKLRAIMENFISFFKKRRWARSLALSLSILLISFSSYGGIFLGERLFPLCLDLRPSRWNGRAGRRFGRAD